MRSKRDDLIIVNAAIGYNAKTWWPFNVKVNLLVNSDCMSLPELY